MYPMGSVCMRLDSTCSKIVPLANYQAKRTSSCYPPDDCERSERSQALLAAHNRPGILLMPVQGPAVAILRRRLTSLTLTAGEA